LKPPPLDTLIFSCAARFNLSVIDVPALINGCRFQASPAIGQPLPPTYAAELSEDREIFNSDDNADNNNDDLPSVRQILASASLKRATKVIDLTYDDNNNNKSDGSNYTEVRYLRYTRIT
jgi:hypothetical protein